MSEEADHGVVPSGLAAELATPPSGGEPAAATPAATVVVLRDGRAGPEVLMLRRRRGGAFGGLWVFPGGKVEPADIGDPVTHHSDPAEPEVPPARRAAVREAAEECGVHLDAAALVAHSFWLPPPQAPRRFSTWFFVAAAPPRAGVVAAPDLAEVREVRWVTPAEAIAARDAGDLPLAPPTWVTLWQLRDLPDVAAALAEAAGRPPRRFVTRLTAVEDGHVLMWEGDAGWADTDPSRPGPRRRLWASERGPWLPEFPGGPGA